MNDNSYWVDVLHYVVLSIADSQPAKWLDGCFLSHLAQVFHLVFDKIPQWHLFFANFW